MRIRERIQKTHTAKVTMVGSFRATAWFGAAAFTGHPKYLDNDV